MEGQSVSKSDKIEKIKATSQIPKDITENIVNLDEERNTKLFDNNKEENLKKDVKNSKKG